MIKETARRLLPQAVYATARKWVRSYGRGQEHRRPQLSEERFVQDLSTDLGLCQGEVVFVHSSLDRLNLDFSFMRVLPLLRRAVGTTGTLLFPATQLRERPEVWLQRGEVFDVARSPTTMGLLAEMARRQRDAVRSLHPTHSVVALGPQAHELVGEHHLDLYPCGEKSPYYKMIEGGGCIVGLGVDADVLTAVHCIEDILKQRFPVETHRARSYTAKVRGQGGEVDVQTLVAHPRIRWRHMLAYMRRRIGPEICRRFTVEGCPFYALSAAVLYARMEELAGRGITMYTRGIYRDSAVEPLLSRLAERLEER